MAEINEMIKNKIKGYPSEVQKIITKALELAKTNKETGIADNLEAVLRAIVKE